MSLYFGYAKENLFTKKTNSERNNLFFDELLILLYNLNFVIAQSADVWFVLE